MKPLNKFLVEKIGRQKAATILMILFLLIALFHLLVIIGLIPDSIVWGGQLSSREEIVVMEWVSVIVNLIIVFLSFRVYQSAPGRGLRVLFFILCGLFVLNTIGNLFAVNQWERIIFTPLTLLSSILCYRIGIGN